MNNVSLKGVIKDIEPSHTVKDIIFDKAKLLVPNSKGSEDVIDIKFKRFSNKYKDNDIVQLTGNIRSFSRKISDKKNKVDIYVFTYFDDATSDEFNEVNIDGRICKIDKIRVTKSGKHNIHFIIANNINCEENRRLNSYIPCLAWGKLAKEISKLPISTKLNIKGTLHSREHRTYDENNEMHISVAHEVIVDSYEVIE